MIEFPFYDAYSDGFHTWRARVNFLTRWAEQELINLSTEDFKAKGIEQGSFCQFSVHREHGVPGNKRQTEEALIGGFTFSTMPGCCGVVVSTNSYILDGLRGDKVLGRIFHKLKEHVARELGYSKMIATVQALNLPEVIGGSKAGWKLAEPFRNKRSGNDIFFMFKDLK